MPETKRKPRYKRVATRSFILTERDRRILRHVWEYGILDSNHIVRLLGEGSAQQIRRRLQLLFHNRYLSRPRVRSFTSERKLVPRAFAYTLDTRGADLLAEETGLLRSEIDRTRRRRRRAESHSLMTNGIMVAFEAACRKHGQMRVIPWSEILATKCPDATKTMKRPQTWQIAVQGKGRIGVTPDRIFGLHYLNRPEGKNRAYFFLEADAATEAIRRRTLAQTSVYRKMLAYHATAVQRFQERRFGIKNFRVLFVAKSPEEKRVKTMLGAARTLPGLHGIFLFASEERLLGEGPLALRWQSAGAAAVRLAE